MTTSLPLTTFEIQSHFKYILFCAGSCLGGTSAEQSPLLAMIGPCVRAIDAKLAAQQSAREVVRIAGRGR